jgi:hypothetical protein
MDLVAYRPRPERTRVVREIFFRFLLVLFGVLAALLVTETTLRVTAAYDGFGCARELPQFRADPAWSRMFCLDPEFGFRPVLGTALYSTFGTVTNTYPVAKRPGTTRLLFIGDSVTFRGRIIAALRVRYGDAGREYWNAGVESFNTVQEARYYKRYNAGLHPDHVILTFHLNDFETTPVAFKDAQGRLNVYAPNCPARFLNERLFRLSRVYRLLAGLLLRGNRQIDAVIDETRKALTDLQATLNQEHIAFSVIVMPFLKPYADWEPGDKLARDQILDILRGLRIRHFDLLAAATRAMDAGVPMCETSGDDWHPSEEAAACFADELQRQGLLPLGLPASP